MARARRGTIGWLGAAAWVGMVACSAEGALSDDAPPAAPSTTTAGAGGGDGGGAATSGGADGGGGEACVPETCASLEATCGMVSDGCGDTLDCGTCCEPATCASAGKDCGTLGDGCGGQINCGTCTGPGETCEDNVCSCVPTGCGVLGCGTHDDGCGGTVDCGACGCATTTADCTATQLANDTCFGDCDGIAANGCETNIYSGSLSNNVTHCGGCNDACGPNDQYCFEGDCYD